MTACHKLQVRTIRDFLSRSKRDFTSLRNCGKRTYDDLVLRVHQFLTNMQGTDSAELSTHSLNRTLIDVVDNPRALRAFATLDIHTIQDFLETPKRHLLAVRGLGERTYWEVTQRIRELSGSRSLPPSLLPDVLREFPVNRIRIEPSLSAALERHEITTVGDLFAVSIEELENDTCIGSDGVAQLRMAVDQLIRRGTDQRTGNLANDQCADLTDMVRQLVDVLDHTQSALFGLRIDLEGQPMSLKKIATHLPIGEEEGPIGEEHPPIARSTPMGDPPSEPTLSPQTVT